MRREIVVSHLSSGEGKGGGAGGAATAWMEVFSSSRVILKIMQRKNIHEIYPSRYLSVISFQNVNTNSLAAGNNGCNFKCVISKYILMIEKETSLISLCFSGILK